MAVGLGLQPNEVLLIVGETLGLLTGGRFGRSALCTVCTVDSGTAVATHGTERLLTVPDCCTVRVPSSTAIVPLHPYGKCCTPKGMLLVAADARASHAHCGTAALRQAAHSALMGASLGHSG